MIVRPATIADLPALVAIGPRFVGNSGYKGKLAVDTGHLAKSLGNLLASPDALIAVYEIDRRIVGAIGAFIAPDIFSGALKASEFTWWVDEDARGMGCGKALMAFYVGWAASKGAHSLSMSEPPDAPKVGELYAANGFRKLETTWELVICQPSHQSP